MKIRISVNPNHSAYQPTMPPPVLIEVPQEGRIIQEHNTRIILNYAMMVFRDYLRFRNKSKLVMFGTGDCVEAARVDGASELQVYRRIILPMLWPVTLSAVIILGHISLKVFDLIIAVAGKQLPLDVPAIYMWQTTFDGLFYGRGASIGILLLISVAVLIIPYLYYSLRSGGES